MSVCSPSKALGLAAVKVNVSITSKLRAIITHQFQDF